MVSHALARHQIGKQQSLHRTVAKSRITGEPNQTTRCRKPDNTCTHRCNDEDCSDPRRARDRHSWPQAGAAAARRAPARAPPRMAISAPSTATASSPTRSPTATGRLNAAFKEKGFSDVWTKEHYGELLETGGGKERMTATGTRWVAGYDCRRSSRTRQERSPETAIFNDDHEGRDSDPKGVLNLIERP